MLRMVMAVLSFALIVHASEAPGQSAIGEAPQNPGLVIPLDGLVIEHATNSGIVGEALRHFRERVAALGGPQVSVEKAGVKGKVIRVGEAVPGSALETSLGRDIIDSHVSGLRDFQKKECWFVSLPGNGSLCAGGLAPLGTVYAISELELRLRLKDGKVVLEFPEWAAGAGPKILFDKPAIAGRGEYLNIGYNLQRITPHEWDADRWQAYIDKLILAKLNRLYFYLWIDTYTIYPGSDLSKQPLNQHIHQELRGMIRYAHRRGLDVTFMCCPSFFPRDVWEAHPDMQADIEYVQHGFPAVCSSAPGAWALMKDVARSEMEWFQEADAIQIWFYDPGGCWCTKYGCKENQAEILERQVKEFSGLFRERNPKARVEYNYWPMWLWEQTEKIKYREDLDRRIQTAFGDDFKTVTAVGAPDADITMPLPEQAMGFRTGIFLFGTNPERGYVFTIPQLDWLRNTAQMLADRGFNAVFGHRLEAWTRYPQTFFMAQFLWNPSQTPDTVVRTYADWQTADVALGARLAEALLLLDRFTNEGSDADLGARMETLAREAYDGSLPVCRRDFDYLPATMTALKIIAESKGEADSPELDPFVKRFEEAMDSSESFAAWKRDSRNIILSYRGLVEKGWIKEPF